MMILGYKKYRYSCTVSYTQYCTIKKKGEEKKVLEKLWLVQRWNEMIVSVWYWWQEWGVKLIIINKEINEKKVCYLRRSFSGVWADLGRGCFIRSRQCRIRATMIPIRMTQTINPTIIRISCQSTGINATRHVWLSLVFQLNNKALL